LPEETFGEKTEAATPRKRQEARERGHVAKSTELNSAVVLLFGIIAIGLFGKGIFTTVLKITNYTADLVLIFDPGVDEIVEMSQFLVGHMARALAPILMTVFVTALAINLAQVGFLVSATPLIPDFKRLSPINGIKKIFSFRGLMNLFVSAFKVLLIGAIAYATIRAEAGRFTALVDLGFWDIFTYGAGVVSKLGIRVGIALVVLAIIDYAYQRWQYERDLRMSRQEVREELKRMEGDPMIRQRRRSLQRQLAMTRMMAEVPKAEVVITNPTHLALAIQYKRDEMAAPKLVAKGRDNMAHRIVQTAVANSVPIVERKPLAQALFKALEVGDEIPEKFYKPVAEVLAYVFNLDRKIARSEAS